MLKNMHRDTQTSQTLMRLGFYEVRNFWSVDAAMSVRIWGDTWNISEIFCASNYDHFDQNVRITIFCKQQRYSYSFRLSTEKVIVWVEINVSILVFRTGCKINLRFSVEFDGTKYPMSVVFKTLVALWNDFYVACLPRVCIDCENLSKLSSHHVKSPAGDVLYF